MKLILASSSPQRKTLLEGLGIPFTVVHSKVQEDLHEEKDPALRAKNLARLKAQDVHVVHPDSVVIGCDTLVVAVDGSLLEKPENEVEALEMLSKQSGATSIVHSALCIIDAHGKLHEGINSSSVTFAELSAEEKEWWISTKLWQGRSGGFQIDGPGQLLISHIKGDWTGIVGLPIFLLGQLLRKAGVEVSIY